MSLETTTGRILAAPDPIHDLINKSHRLAEEAVQPLPVLGYPDGIRQNPDPRIVNLAEAVKQLCAVLSVIHTKTR